MNESGIEPKEEQERTTRKKKIFLEAFMESLGVIKIACNKAGIDRRTHYAWCKTDDVFKQQCEEIKEIQFGYVNDKFLELIAAGNGKAIMFYLAKRGTEYKDKLELSGEVTTRAEFASLSDEDLAKILEDARKFKIEQENGNSETKTL